MGPLIPICKKRPTDTVRGVTSREVSKGGGSKKMTGKIPQEVESTREPESQKKKKLSAGGYWGIRTTMTSAG